MFELQEVSQQAQLIRGRERLCLSGMMDVQQKSRPRVASVKFILAKKKKEKIRKQLERLSVHLRNLHTKT